MLLALVLGLSVICCAWRPWAVLPLILMIASIYPPTIGRLVPIGNSTLSSLYETIIMIALVGLIRLRAAGPYLARESVPLLIIAIPLIAGGLGVGTFNDFISSEKPLVLIAVVTIIAMRVARCYTSATRSFVLPAICWIAAVESILGVYQRGAHSWGYYDHAATTAQSMSTAFPGRAGGTFGHPSVLGIFAAVALVIALELRFKSWVFVAVIDFAGVVASGGRSAVAALLIGVVIAVCIPLKSGTWHRPRSIPSMATVTIAPLVVILLGLSFTDIAQTFVGSEFTQRFTDLGADQSVTAHQYRQSVAWHLISAHPESFLVGHGPGYAIHYLVDFGFNDGQAPAFDNTYLSLWIDYGIVGLGILAVLAVLAVRRAGFGTATAVALAVACYGFDIQGWPVILVLLSVAFGAISSLPKKSVPWTAKPPAKSRRPPIRV